MPSDADGAKSENDTANAGIRREPELVACEQSDFWKVSLFLPLIL
jgi:hypothetical protein